VVFGGAGGTAWEGAKGDQLKAQIPTGRFAYPEEIAGRQCSVSGSIATSILDIGF
jgi:D-threitol dehydrogenase (NAD+)